MAALTQGDLHVQAAVPVMEIRQFHMKVQANAHPAFYLEGMLSEEAGEEGIRIPLSGTTVRLGAGIACSLPGYWKRLRWCRKAVDMRSS